MQVIHKYSVPPSDGCQTPSEGFHLQVIHKFNVPPFDGCQTPSEGFRLQVIHKLVNGLPYEDFGIPQKEFFVMYNLLMESPILHESGESRCTPIPGNHWVLDQACLLNEADSLLCRAVFFLKFFVSCIKPPLLKSIMLSISHTAKTVK